MMDDEWSQYYKYKSFLNIKRIQDDQNIIKRVRKWLDIDIENNDAHSEKPFYRDPRMVRNIGTINNQLATGI